MVPKISTGKLAGVSYSRVSILPLKIRQKNGRDELLTCDSLCEQGGRKEGRGMMAPGFVTQHKIKE